MVNQININEHLTHSTYLSLRIILHSCQKQQQNPGRRGRKRRGRRDGTKRERERRRGETNLAKHGGSTHFHCACIDMQHEFDVTPFINFYRSGIIFQ
jgi:hypothetical protein